MLLNRKKEFEEWRQFSERIASADVRTAILTHLRQMQGDPTLVLSEETFSDVLIAYWNEKLGETYYLLAIEMGTQVASFLENIDKTLERLAVLNHGRFNWTELQGTLFSQKALARMKDMLVMVKQFQTGEDLADWISRC